MGDRGRMRPKGNLLRGEHPCTAPGYRGRDDPAEVRSYPRLAGLPSYEDTVTRWEQASGFSAGDYDYYLVFAGMRYGLILSRIMLATGQEGEVQGNFACQLLQKTLDRIA